MTISADELGAIPVQPVSVSAQDLGAVPIQGQSNADALAQAGIGSDVQDRMVSMSNIPDQAAAALDQSASPLAQFGHGVYQSYAGTAQDAMHVWNVVQNLNDMINTRFHNPVANRTAHALLSMFTNITPFTQAANTVAPYLPQGNIQKMTGSLDDAIRSDEQTYNANNSGLQSGALTMLGNLASPVSLLGGGDAALGKGLLSKALGNIPIGVMFGITQPVTSKTYWKDKGIQAAIGGAVASASSLATSLVGKTLGFVKNAARYLGNEKDYVYKDLQEFLQKNLWENKDQIQKVVRNAILNGDKRSVMQIISDHLANGPDGKVFGGLLMKLHSDLEREFDSAKSIFSLQKADHQTILDTLAGAPGQLDNAIKWRATRAWEQYQKSFSQDLLKVLPDDTVTKILDNPIGQKAKEAVAKFYNKDPGTNYTEYYHLVKRALDDQMQSGNFEKPLIPEKVDAINTVKQNLLGWLEHKNQFYKSARVGYQLDSGPINKMTVGQKLKDAYANELQQQTPGTFARFMRNSYSEIKNRIGKDRFNKLSDILSPDEQNSLTGIIKDMRAQKTYESLAGDSKSILSGLESGVNIDLPHIIYRPFVIANSFMRKFAEDKTLIYKQTLMKILTDPVEFARLYGGNPSQPKTQAAIDIAHRINAYLLQQAPAQTIANIAGAQ